jgi:peptidoglycan hydrolase-like protein with peptidoglycan-binding domain
LGSTGSDVKALQQFLNLRGFYVSLTGIGSKGNESTYFGPATTKAVAKFQLANGILPASGLFGPITTKKVNSMLGTSTSVPCTTTTTVTTSSTYTRSLTIGSTGSDVKALQVFLNKHGFQISLSGPGSPNNESTYFGPATASALAKFQASKGISPAAGYFGPKTMGVVAGIK